MTPPVDITIVLNHGRIQEITPRAGFRFIIHNYGVDTVREARKRHAVFLDEAGDWYAKDIWEEQLG